MEQATNKQAVLDRGQALLDKGDVGGYWKLMSEHSGYARLAGEIASGKGFFAHLVTARLQRAARKTRGRELTAKEMDALRLNIAWGDQQRRNQNLKDYGHIGVSGKDTVGYHKQVFEDAKLPADTYTPAHLQNVVGSYWSKALGAPTHDARDMDLAEAAAEMKRRYERDPEGFLKELGELGLDALETGMDATDFIGDDRTLTSPAGVGHDPLERVGEPPAKSPGAKDGPKDAPATEPGDPDGGAGDDRLSGGEGRDKPFTPEQEKLAAAFEKNDGPLDEILAKRPEDLTADEARMVMKARIALPMGAEHDRLFAFEKAYFEDAYGTGQVERDAAGRMIEPKPRRALPAEPKPATTPDGEKLAEAMARIGRKVAGAAADEGEADAVKGLQSGLNLLARVLAGRFGGRAAFPGRTPDFNPAVRGRSAAPRRRPGSVIWPELRTDGVVGPKTRAAVRGAAAELGVGRIDEGLALGRFGRYARRVETGRARAGDLADSVARDFAPLFGKPTKARPGGVSGGGGEGFAVQAAINDLGADVIGKGRYQPIREDGVLGPRTRDAFARVVTAGGANRFTVGLGRNLGFFDFE